MTVDPSGQAALVTVGEEYDFAMFGDGRLALRRRDVHAETVRLTVQDQEWHHVAVVGFW